MIRCGVHINLISDLTKIADECIEIKPAVLLAVPRVWNKFYDRVNSQFEAATGLENLRHRAQKSAAKRIAKAGVECDAVPPSGFFDKLWDKLVWSKVRADSVETSASACPVLLRFRLMSPLSFNGRLPATKATG